MQLLMLRDGYQDMKANPPLIEKPILKLYICLKVITA